MKNRISIIIPILLFSISIIFFSSCKDSKSTKDVACDINDWLPSDIISKNNLISLAEATRQIHFPESMQLKNRALEKEHSK